MILKKLLLISLLMLTLLSSYSNSFGLSYYEGVPSSTNTLNVCDDIANTPNAPYCKTTTTNKTLKVQVLDLVNSVNNFLYVLVPSIGRFVTGLYSIALVSFAKSTTA